MAEKSPTPTIEDYLGIVYTLERDGEDVIGARLSELLEVSPPTVTVTLHRMVRDGWIKISDGKKVKLTPAGVEAAEAVIRRHMLTEWMLSKILNMPWSKIHEEAHKIEHTISGEVEMSLIEKLDDPELCPHGNPMPGLESLSSSWIPLAEVQVNDQVIIRRIHEFLEEDPVLMGFLENNQIVPGNLVKIIEVLPFNKTLTLRTKSQKVTLGMDIARSIFIEKSNNEESK